MKKAISLIVLISLLLTFLVLNIHKTSENNGAPPYQVLETVPDDGEADDLLQDWVRPDSPPKVALQVGHWKNNEIPEELEKLRGNTGASGGGKTEWEVNFEIAKRAKNMLEEKGITVELLPATVPERYWADVFVAIHADGSEDRSKSGFKAAIPRRDLTGNADELLTSLENAYQEATGFEKDPNVTRNMRGYYAFGWWRYTHAVHPMTTAAILETGFLTNAQDRTIIVEQPQIAAEGLAKGIVEYLKYQKLVES